MPSLLMILLTACPAEKQPEWATASARAKRDLLRACGRVVAPVAETAPPFDPIIPRPVKPAVVLERRATRPTMGLSVGTLLGRAFLPPRPGLTGTEADLVAGLTVESSAIFRVGERVELQPGVAIFGAMHFVSTALIGLALGGRVRVGWNERLVSGVGAYAGWGRFFSLGDAGPFGPGGWNSDAAMAHLYVTLLGVRVSPAARLALDAGVTGWLRNLSTAPAAELATWGRLALELDLDF